MLSDLRIVINFNLLLLTVDLRNGDAVAVYVRYLPHDRVREHWIIGKQVQRVKCVTEGLDLYFSKVIVDHYGGSIVLDSQEGSGTIVRIRLPQANTSPRGAKQK